MWRDQACLPVALAGVSAFNGRVGPVTLNQNDIIAAGGLTGNAGDLATQDFVAAAIAEALLTGVAGVVTFNGRNGAVALNVFDITGAGGAPIASPNLAGVPRAPTPQPNSSSTEIATTAFVKNALAAGAGSQILLGTVTFDGTQQSAVFNNLTDAYSVYELEFINIIPTSVIPNGSGPVLRFSSDNGNTFDTNSNYLWNVLYVNPTPIGEDNSVGANATSFISLSSMNTTNGGISSTPTNAGYCGRARMYGLSRNGLQKHVFSSGVAVLGLATMVSLTGAGVYANGPVYPPVNAVQLSFLSLMLQPASLVFGTVKLYGIV